ncbi:hypothetical protein K437DRAFT_258276 [Tilletiaria anomala UBC 951]|uniref:Uncharacterized protein n=1 Tax=Tilletiaria anomala (strain ATCC 24038 / CBS 436.72 / UBC 951) TaxID=1037660 RepID=A0A066VI91_TILAU|nr:uncharacterized protein K437DRAFT_258276 [Tilletiaria anomala UBC 951]KDN41432.1 hypothetical protein K437DRAFT_258276 [Tilletiaria anomala UBC 951]
MFHADCQLRTSQAPFCKAQAAATPCVPTPPPSGCPLPSPPLPPVSRTACSRRCVTPAYQPPLSAILYNLKTPRDLSRSAPLRPS